MALIKRSALAASCAALACAAAGPVDLTNISPASNWQGGFDVSGQNRSVRPGDDFYAFANGEAIDRLVIPPDRASTGVIASLQTLSEERVHLILEATAAGAPAMPARDGEKAGAFYRAFMDEARVEELGPTPIASDLGSVRNVSNRAALAGLMGRVNEGAFASLLSVTIDVDEDRPDHYAVHLGQAGLGLPDRDYYIQPQFSSKVALYQSYVERMLALAGQPDPSGDAARVVAFETRIAEASLSKVDRRDPVKLYNPMTLAEVEAREPGFPWAAFMTGSGLSHVTRVVEQEKDAVAKTAALYSETPLETLKAWETFHLVDRAAPYLSRPFVDASFGFHGKGLTGQPLLQARWKRAVQELNGDMGEAVGQIYVARYFPPASKVLAMGMARRIQTALRRRIEALDWMDPTTKSEALRKLAAYKIKMGYPDHWRDYSALTIRSDDLLGDVRRSAAFEWERKVRRLDQPVDRSEWGLPPQVVQAYNDPARNELLFTAAILQPPLFDTAVDPAVIYGGAGAVMGHEMTHGFDDQGRKYDAAGRLRDWWTPEDAKRFQTRADRLVAQFDKYKPLADGPHVDGRLTLGENIADLGGVSLALDAYHAALGNHPAPVINGYTGEQRVFLGWAQAWRAKVRDDRLRRLLATDPHSPDRYRVNGALRNIGGWYAAFHVSPGVDLYLPPEERVEIW